jgi:hypothetical protein
VLRWALLVVPYTVLPQPADLDLFPEIFVSEHTPIHLKLMPVSPAVAYLGSDLNPIVVSVLGEIQTEPRGAFS